MNQLFGVPENSTLAYCSAPMFVVEGESLRLRTQHDETIPVMTQTLIRRTPGVFQARAHAIGASSEGGQEHASW